MDSTTCKKDHGHGFEIKKVKFGSKNIGKWVGGSKKQYKWKLAIDSKLLTIKHNHSDSGHRQTFFNDETMWDTKLPKTELFAKTFQFGELTIIIQETSPQKYSLTIETLSYES